MADPHRSTAFNAAAQVLCITARAWGVQLPAGSRATAPARRLTDRLTAYRDRRAASPSRLRLSAHGFDISY
ncbi:hypothetical protein [Acidovorax sp. FG27]|uniref:hypothetical protein n=1 Tax=Acidovorax sp. FG27 TaxID=3133652 RepID=UPI0030E8791B